MTNFSLVVYVNAYIRPFPSINLDKKQLKRKYFEAALSLFITFEDS